MHRAAGLIFDDSKHYIDHLGPFCALMGWPLIVCEPSVAELTRRYYPDLQIIETSIWDLQLPPNLVSCNPLPFLEAQFRFGNRTLFWLPHGNSDKKTFVKGLLQKEIALVYGQRMIDFMKENEVVPTCIRIGNFRYHYFLQNQNFYASQLPFLSGEKTILYAPTWDESSSFWKSISHMIDALNRRYQLLIKIHPNTVLKFAPELEILKGRYEKKNVLFLDDFPPIYPLLHRTDIYVGDRSSIGYDFLTFNRPMFFLDQNAPLFSCGREIEVEELARFLDESQKELAFQRKMTYTSTFDSLEDWGPIAQAIERRLS